MDPGLRRDDDLKSGRLFNRRSSFLGRNTFQPSFQRKLEPIAD